MESTEDDLLKHPYYWAAFTVSGNTAPLLNSHSKWWWLLALAMMSFGLWRWKRKH